MRGSRTVSCMTGFEICVLLCGAFYFSDNSEELFANTANYGTFIKREDSKCTKTRP